MRGWSKNLGRKLFSVFAAAVLWFVFVGRSEIATSIPVVVQYRNLPPDLEITADPPDRLFMKLRGPVSRLTAAELSAVSLTLDLASANKPGDQTVTISERELGLPAGVSLMRVVPSQVRVTLDRRAEKTVPVEVRFSGPPPAGYRIVAQTVTPGAVRVVGPEPRLGRLSAALTDPVDLGATVGDAEFRVPLYFGDPHIRLHSGPALVTVRVRLERIPRT